MIRLHFVVEGQTEETFVNDLLTPVLAELNIFADVRCVQTGYKRGKKHKGGVTHYIKLKNDLQRWLKQDEHIEAMFTTMFDFYALPHDFPGYAESNQQTDLKARIEQLELCFQADIGDHRFIPYLQLHEFEALLFSEPSLPLLILIENVKSNNWLQCVLVLLLPKRLMKVKIPVLPNVSKPSYLITTKYRLALVSL